MCGWTGADVIELAGITVAIICTALGLAVALYAASAAVLHSAQRLVNANRVRRLGNALAARVLTGELQPELFDDALEATAKEVTEQHAAITSQAAELAGVMLDVQQRRAVLANPLATPEAREAAITAPLGGWAQ